MSKAVFKKLLRAATLAALVYVNVLLLYPVAESAAVGDDAGRALRLHERGMDLVDSDPEEAIALLTEAARLAPGNAVYRMSLGDACLTAHGRLHYQNGPAAAALYRSAEVAYGEARILAPRDWTCLSVYARHIYAAPTFGVERDWDKVMRAWEDCLALTREDFDRDSSYQFARICALRTAGYAAVQAGDLPRAKGYLARIGEHSLGAPTAKRLRAQIEAAEASCTPEN